MPWTTFVIFTAVSWDAMPRLVERARRNFNDRCDLLSRPGASDVRCSGLSPFRDNAACPELGRDLGKLPLVQAPYPWQLCTQNGSPGAVGHHPERCRSLMFGLGTIEWPTWDLPAWQLPAESSLKQSLALGRSRPVLGDAGAILQDEAAEANSAGLPMVVEPPLLQRRSAPDCRFAAA